MNPILGDTVPFRNMGGPHNVHANDDSFRCANGCDGAGEVLPDDQILARWFAFNPDDTQQSWLGNVGIIGGGIATVDAVLTGRPMDSEFRSFTRHATGAGSSDLCVHGLQSRSRSIFTSSVTGCGEGHLDPTRLTQPASLRVRKPDRLAQSQEHAMKRNFALLATAAALALSGLSAHAGCVDPRVMVQNAATRTPPVIVMPKTEAMNDRDNGGHNGIVGTWQVSYTSGGSPAGEAFIQWHDDGTEFENIDFPILGGNICMGSWRQLDHRHVSRVAHRLAVHGRKPDRLLHRDRDRHGVARRQFLYGQQRHEDL